MDGLLHEDLTAIEIVSPFLKQCVGKGKEIPPGNILQVQQITNVSFPTYDKPVYDSEKHVLKLTVTDGQSQGYAIVPDSCPGLGLNTPPGTKIRTTQAIPVQGSLFVLTRNNCEVLGGRVIKLYEKWEAQRKHAIKHEWGYTGTAVEGEGPPPWKPFGYKPSIDVAALRKMKTIDVVNEKKDGPTGGAKSQFDMQRDEAISELQATANKQKFSKPNKHLLDKEITDIMDEGFSQSEAEYAMNRFKNTQKALKFLKDSKKHQDGAPREPPKAPLERKDRRRKGKGNDEDEEQEVPAEYQRPTRSISLFGFIEGQIKTDSKSTTQSNGPAQNHGGGRGRDLEDGMSRLKLNSRDTKSDTYGGRGYERGERGRGRGYRGGGRGGGGDSFHNSQRYDNSGSQRYENSGSQRYENSSSQRYENSGSQRYDNSSSQRYDSSSQRQESNSQRYDNSSQQRYENKGPGMGKSETTTQRPPRFQNRGGPDIRQTDYHSSGSRGSGYDGYKERGQNKDSYDSSRSYHETSSSRQEYSGNYQSHQQRPPSGKDRSYSSEYNQPPQQQQQQQQYSKSNTDYPVPSQTYQQHSYQHQPSQQRQYQNASSQNHEPMGHRGGASGQQRPPHSQYTNHSSGSHPPNQQHPSGGEFTHYQYGYEGYNPAQSLVFTRSKPDNRGGRGSYQGNGRGAAPQSSAYGRSNPGGRY